MESGLVTLRLGPALGVGRLRELLELLAAMRRLREPLGEPEGLRGALGIVLRLAELLGVNEALVERLRRVMEDEATFELVLAIVRYVGSWTERGEFRAREEGELVLESASFVEWLPVAIALIELIRRLRGER